MYDLLVRSYLTPGSLEAMQTPRSRHGCPRTGSLAFQRLPPREFLFLCFIMWGHATLADSPTLPLGPFSNRGQWERHSERKFWLTSAARCTTLREFHHHDRSTPMAASWSRDQIAGRHQIHGRLLWRCQIWSTVCVPTTTQATGVRVRPSYTKDLRAPVLCTLTTGKLCVALSTETMDAKTTSGK